MDRKEAMLTIEDGIRKLRLLDAKGKVWTQDMILQVDGKAVSLLDNDSKVRTSQSAIRPPMIRMWPDLVCLSERAGELFSGLDPALSGRDERLQLRLHPGTGV